MSEPVIIPVEPFDAKRLALRAQELDQAGVKWEFDWMKPEQARKVTHWLEHLGVVPFGTTDDVLGRGKILGDEP